MRVITLLNRKGGVGKSSTCHHLAGSLSKMGKRVLLVDNDPQASLSQGFLGPDAVRTLDPASSIAEVYAGGRPFPSALIRPSGVPRVDLVPASLAAEDYNTPMPLDGPMGRVRDLPDFLHAIDPAAYDLTLLDCPPNLYLYSLAALAASHHLVVPVHPEDYGMQGLADVFEFADRVAAFDNPGLTSLGIVLTKCVFRKTIHRFNEEQLRELYGDRVFRTRIPDAVAFVESLGRRVPVEQYQHRSAAASSMRALAVEVLERAGLPLGRTPSASSPRPSTLTPAEVL